MYEFEVGCVPKPLAGLVHHSLGLELGLGRGLGLLMAPRAVSKQTQLRTATPAKIHATQHAAPVAAA